MVDWPTALPDKPLAEGFAETVPDQVLRTEMDQGPAKLRRKTTAGVRRIQAKYILSATQVAALDSFYDTDLKAGSLSFSYTHPRTGVLETVRFMAPPEYASVNGHYFQTNLQMEILP